MAHCRGKTAATYQPSMDMGSYVVIINAEKVKVTGNKEQQKMYYRHTGRPGSLKEEKLQEAAGGEWNWLWPCTANLWTWYRTSCLSARRALNNYRR